MYARKCLRHLIISTSLDMNQTHTQYPNFRIPAE